MDDSLETSDPEERRRSTSKDDARIMNTLTQDNTTTQDNGTTTDGRKRGQEEERTKM